MLKSLNLVLLLIIYFCQDTKLDSYVLKLKKLFSGLKLEKFVRIFSL